MTTSPATKRPMKPIKAWALVFDHLPIMPIIYMTRRLACEMKERDYINARIARVIIKEHDNG